VENRGAGTVNGGSSTRQRPLIYDDLRKELSVVVVVIRVNVSHSVFTELAQCSGFISFGNVDQVACRPNFNTDQHEVDTLLMKQL